jgi:uncharacterized protein (DUF934 family)
MRHILRRRELVEDNWRYWGEEGASGDKVSGPVVIPLAEYRTNISRWRTYSDPLGIRLSPADAVEELAGDIHRFALVASEFPSPGDGRGFSQGRVLRSHLHYKGELRAVGAAVKQDLLFIMSRCGFDSFDLASGQKVDEALSALDRYSVAYQPAEPVPAIRQQRFFTAQATRSP